jgi:hypothetical protein
MVCTDVCICDVQQAVTCLCLCSFHHYLNSCIRNNCFTVRQTSKVLLAKKFTQQSTGQDLLTSFRNISTCYFTLHLQLKPTNTEFIIMPKALNTICRQSITLLVLHIIVCLSSSAYPNVQSSRCNCHKSRSLLR